MGSVKFSKVVPTRTIELPSYPGSEVVMYDVLSVGEERILIKSFYMGKEKGDIDHLEYGIEKLCKHIKSWNFVDDNEEPVPVNAETLSQIPMQDVLFMLDALKDEEALSEEDKKKEPETGSKHGTA